MLPHVQATRFVVPLKEGGSLPGVVEASDDGTYVMKFRGAGQGLKVLVAEVLVGGLARRLGIRTPDLVVMDLPESIAKYEADEEVQDLLTASLGTNLGVDFLPGAFDYNGSRPAPEDEGAAILWLDALTANIDRTWRNPNLLVWHRKAWAIDHGASLYFHHSWPSKAPSPERFAAQRFDASDHVMLEHAIALPATHERLAPLVTRETIAEILADVPDEWIEPAVGHDTPDAVRDVYADMLLARLATPEAWLPEAPR
ncbi:HipA family kinase [Actinomycetota bacterium]